MNSIFTSVVITSCIIFSGHTFAQDYTVDYSAETYTPLTTDTTIINESETEVIETVTFYKPIPLGFDFEFLGIVYDTIYLHEDGFAGFVTGSTYDSWISIFDCDLKDFQDDPLLSPIVYKTEGAAGSRIFKCEYVSAGYENDLEDNDSISFQLWIHEFCNTFEVRIGPGFNDAAETDLYYNDETSPFIGYGDRAPLSPFHLAGDPVAPTQDPDPLDVLDTIPDAGSVYHFYNCLVGINEKSARDISVFPNPVSNQLTVQFENLKEYAHLEIMNISGQIVLSEVITETNTMTVDVAELESGIYFIRFLNEESTEAIRFVKE